MSFVIRILEIWNTQKKYLELTNLKRTWQIEAKIKLITGPGESK